MQRTLMKDSTDRVGQDITIKGWVIARRDHGKIIFLDVKDRSGILQIVGDQTLADLRPSDVVEIRGSVAKRPENLVNPKLATGTVELQAKETCITSKAEDLPFPTDDDGTTIDEEIRLKYRYLDLRRPRLQQNLKIRHDVMLFLRKFLSERDFLEIETPMLTKTTPEGARDFLVPSRLQPGKFYALPQSPQQYKQLLMVAEFERYFQIARCFRDEDPRADRAYGEFTQLDLEMAFVEQEDVLTLTEELFTHLVHTVFPTKQIAKTPWPRLPHADAMKQYGSDKPDLRANKTDKDELAFAWILDFPLFIQQTKNDFYHGSGSASFAPSHHMFTAPHPDDIPLLHTDPLKARGLQYDLILNGVEIGGGSIRIHDRHIQEKVFDLIGFSEEQKTKFAHLLTAFTYGVPPHGGIAPGIDRFLYAVLGEKSLREVIAFPTSSSGFTAVMDAPSEATGGQLQEVHLKIV